MLRAILVLTAALGCFGLAVSAQTISEKKTAAAKGKDDGKAKAKLPEKAPESKDVPKGKVPFDKMKLPKDAIIVVIDELTELFSSAWVPLEKYSELQEKHKALERQLKPERKAPSWCRLHGRLDGDFLLFRAEFEFSTEFPKTTIVLGLQGGFLTDEGDLDRQTPMVVYDKDEGFLVPVEKEGDHKLTLNFRVPVKRSTTGTTDRDAELGLPGAAATTLNLELPAAVKEIRWNGTLEKARPPGRWQQIGLGKSKKLALTWKEPVGQLGNSPVASVDGQITVAIAEMDVQITADLSFADSQAQTKEWRLLLPANAEVEIKKTPGDLTATLIKPDDKRPYFVLKTSDYTAEPWKVQVSVTVPRPKVGARLPVGPFHVLDAHLHQGTITVQMPSKVSFGQRLVYTRALGTYQKSADVESVFRYVAPVVSDKNLKSALAQRAPLELEWRSQKNQAETHVSHFLQLRSAEPGWEIETTTKIQVKALLGTLHTIELKLPLTTPRGVGMLGTASPGLGFPGCLPWPGIGKIVAGPWSYSIPDDFTVTDELGAPLQLVPQDAAGTMHVLLDRTPPPKQITLIMKNKIRVPLPNQRIRVELAQPLGTLDRSAKLSIQADKKIELVHGPAGAEEPLPERDKFDLNWDQSPGFVDVAWRPLTTKVIAKSTIDVMLHEHTAQVTQTLRFPRDESVPWPDVKQIALSVPARINKVNLLSAGVVLAHDAAREMLWVRPNADPAKADLILQYDIPVTESLDLLSIWPVDVSQRDVKVRVWCPAGVKVGLSEPAIQAGLWKERSVELVAGIDSYPALVVQGYGADVPLTLRIEKATAPTVAAFVADRALIQITTMEDGSQHCRARYLIRKVHGPYVDIALPVPLGQFREPPSILLARRAVPAEPTSQPEVLRVRLHREPTAPLPVILEITYTLPADAGASSWHTVLQAPTFHSEVVIRQMRWQLTTPTPMIAASLGRNVRADVQWDWQGWLLTPEPTVASAEMDGWPAGAEPAPADLGSVTYSFTHVTMQPETVFHLPRSGWLLGCSGVFLVLTLGGYVAPLSRLVYALLLAALALAILFLAWLAPAALPPVLFGLQPGVVLLVAFVGIHWLVQERYRRQLVFLPGFSRKKSGSTLVRTDGPKRPREASTVDAPGAAPEEAAGPKTSSSSS